MRLSDSCLLRSKINKIVITDSFPKLAKQLLYRPGEALRFPGT